MNKSNDTHGWESLISGIAERVLVERLSAAETGGFVLRELDEAMGHMYDAGLENHCWQRIRSSCDRGEKIR